MQSTVKDQQLAQVERARGAIVRGCALIAATELRVQRTRRLLTQTWTDAAVQGPSTLQRQDASVAATSK